MQRDPRAFLWDVKESATQIQTFIDGMDAPDYAVNAMAQAALERKFEIIALYRSDSESWLARLQRVPRHAGYEEQPQNVEPALAPFLAVR